MKRLWPYMYLASAIAIFLCNTGLLQQNYGQTNVDWVFITISLVVMTIFPSMAVSYARARLIIDPPRPSFFRGFKGGWWSDPWQCLLLMTVWAWSWFLGSLFTLPHANQQGVLLICWKAALAIGLLVGSVIARKRYRSKIN